MRGGLSVSQRSKEKSILNKIQQKTATTKDSVWNPKPHWGEGADRVQKSALGQSKSGQIVGKTDQTTKKALPKYKPTPKTAEPE